MNNLTEQQRSLWLSFAKLPCEKIAPLLLEHGSTEWLEEAFFHRSPELMENLTPGEWEQLRFFHDAGRLDPVLSYIKNSSIQVTDLCSERFPDRLKTIPDPPLALFFLGNVEALSSRSLAVVGSRRASEYGRRFTEKIAQALSEAGITIISGFAYGIDSAAHLGCLKGRSPTIAVLGCGLDILYPAGNEPLKNRMLKQGGLLISEYLPGEKPLSHHFPYRNRIISGLSDAVVVMEARIRSGTMRTVDHALSQGRDVFVFPGLPDSDLFSANHALLRDGGRFFTCARDILEDMNWLDNSQNVGQNNVCSSDGHNLSDDERRILRALNPEPLSFDQLALRTDIEPQDLLGRLTVMQVRGLIASLPGKRYEGKIRI